MTRICAGKATCECPNQEGLYYRPGWFRLGSLPSIGDIRRIHKKNLTNEVVKGYLKRGGLAGLLVTGIAGCGQMPTTAAESAATAESRK